MSDENKPETPAKSSQESIVEIAGHINTLEDSILKHVDSAVREASKEKHGHVAGNLTAQDVGYMLKTCGVKPRLASELARTAVQRHERFRWSDEGKRIQMEANLAKGKQ